MKEYTVDFESFEVEAKSYDEAWKIANSQAWKEYGRGLDDELLQDEEQKPNRWTAVFNSLYITAKIMMMRGIKLATLQNSII